MTHIVTLTDADADRYQAFVEQCPDYLVYYSWHYRELLLRLLDCRAVYLAAEDVDGRLVAVLPLMAANGVYGTVYNSLPFFGSHGGVLGTSVAATEQVRDAYSELLAGPNVIAGTVIPNPFSAARPLFPSDFVDERIGSFTSLDGTQDEQVLLGRISASARYDVRLSQRANITVAIENDAFDALRLLHQERMQEIGGRAKPDAFFTLLPKLFRAGGQFDLFVARRDGELVALILLLYGGEVVEYFIPVVRREHRGAQPTAAILFAAMQHAARRGFRLWNWGGTWLSQEGVLRFKRNWGGVDHRYFYYTRVADKSLLDLSADKLQAAYNGFYVVPFDQLTVTKSSATS